MVMMIRSSSSPSRGFLSFVFFVGAVAVEVAVSHAGCAWMLFVSPFLLLRSHHVRDQMLDSNRGDTNMYVY